MLKDPLRRAVFFLAGAIFATTGTTFGANSSDQIARQRARIEAIHARLVQKRQQLDFESLRARDYRRQLSQTTASISVVEMRLGELGQRIQYDRVNKERQQRRLIVAQGALQIHRDAYRNRVIQMYEQPEQNYLTVLFGARSFDDFVERWHDLRLIVAADQREVKAREAAVREINNIRLAITESLMQLQAEQDQQAQARTQLAALAQERESLVALAEHDRSSVANEVAQLSEISAQEEAQLEQLVRAQQAELETERTRGAAPALPPPGSGQMMWPLSGPITSPFGMRPNPFGGGNIEFHPGIDIGVPVGTTVVAAAAGRVIIAGWVSGYGNYIAIDHGGGISTGYGHLSQFFVSVGQDVQRGQAIGASGNTGRSTGPHLIFEVRRDGTPVDPNPYL